MASTHKYQIAAGTGVFLHFVFEVYPVKIIPQTQLLTEFKALADNPKKFDYG